MQKVFSPETVFLLVLSITGEVVGNLFNFYRVFPAFDIATHFVGGALVSTIAIKYLYSKLQSHAYAINIVFTMGIGALWELIEFGIDLLLKTRMQNSLNDTMVDLAMVTLAAIIVNAIYSGKRKEKWV